MLSGGQCDRPDEDGKVSPEEIVPRESDEGETDRGSDITSLRVTATSSDGDVDIRRNLARRRFLSFYCSLTMRW